MLSIENIQPRTALVFGASGITGWSIVREGVNYPTKTTFSRIIGLTTRPADLSKLLLPDDERISIFSGIDLTKSIDDVAEKLAEVDGIEEVTDVFFAAYLQPPGTSDFEGAEVLKRVNVEILETAVLAVERVCPNLKFWSFQTGGKVYGFLHVSQLGLPKTPLQESNERIPEPSAKNLFYYAQYDALKKLSAGKTWKFAEIRPDLVIGFVPGGKSPMNFAQGLGIFLSFYAEHEAGSTTTTKLIPFPGPPVVYKSRYTEIGQRTLGRAHIFASSVDGAPNGAAYNVGDSEPTMGSSWEMNWAGVCAYFGLQGAKPSESSPLSVTRYMMEHQNEWERFEKKHGLHSGIIQSCSWEFVEVLLTLVTFDRQYDLSKVVAAGFSERSDVIQNFVDTWDLMKAAKMLPP